MPDRRQRRTGRLGRRGRLAFEPLEPRLLLARTLYVDDTAAGVNSGVSWTDAYTSLQSALAAAASDDEIWVAQGTYRPATTANRSATFQLKSGVSVYGGFPDGGGTWAQRDWTANATVLSGDLGVAGNNSDNAYHVVTAVGNSVLDGFRITGGNANGSGNNAQGGGIFAQAATPLTISHCTVEDNDASSAAGAYFATSTVTIEQTVFRNNRAPYTTYPSGTGGAMHVQLSSITIRDSVFDSNLAHWGSAIYATSNATLEVSNTLVVNNSTTSHFATVECDDRTTLSLVNSTFAGNGGPSVFLYMYATAEVTNTILWDSYAPRAEDGCSFTFSHSDIRGGLAGIWTRNSTVVDAGGNIDSDPLFLDPADSDGADNRLRTADDGFSLQAASPCRDSGTGADAPTADITGAARPQGGGPDMGAYEHPATAGSALVFDGNDDYVFVPSTPDLDLTGAVTLECWVNMTSYSGWHGLIEKSWGSGGQALGLYLDNAGRLAMFVGYSYVSSSQSVSTGVWHHVAGVRTDAGVVSLYLDGQPIQTGALPAPGSYNYGWHLGHDQGAASASGMVDELAVWNVARTEAEIRQAMLQGLTGAESGLVAYWKLDEGSGQIAGDSSGNGHHGRLGSSDQADSRDPQWTTPGVTRPAGPRVTAMSPRPGATWSQPPTEITVTFSAEMDPATVVTAGFELVGSGEDSVFGTADDRTIAGQFSYQAASRQAKFTPSQPLVSDTYRVTVFDAVQGANHLALDGEWPGSEPGFPTGNGTAGGDFVATFSVVSTDFAPLVVGVHGITAGLDQLPGPLENLGGAVAIAFGDEDTTPLVQQQPPTVVNASVLGAGRGVFFGHEGFFLPGNNTLLDNEVFIANAASWLGGGNKRILFDRFSYNTGWGRNVHAGLVDLLGPAGYTITVASGNLTAAQLAHADILMIAARWDAFTAAELAAVEDFVRGGGGVLATGLAWSWLQGAGRTLANYPMNAIAEMFGVRYVEGMITDPTHNLAEPSEPIFHQFYVPPEPSATLRVISMTPAPGTTVSQTPTEILVTFNRDVETASVSAATFHVYDVGPDGHYGTADDVAVAPREVTYDAALRAARFVPQQPLEAGSTYAVALSSGNTGSIHEDFNDATTDWTYNGSAVRTASYLQLTPVESYRAGTAFFNAPLPAQDFVAEFDFEIHGGSGADGICFVVQNSPEGPSVVNLHGGSFGYADITPSLAVEFDTYDNYYPYDPSENHIGINVDGDVTSQVATANVPEMENTGVFHAVITFRNGRIRVQIQGAGTDGLQTYLDTDVPGWTSSMGYFGFTAGTGALTNFHDIDNFRLETHGTGGIRDLQGNLLDGEFPGSGPAPLPSGDGTEGGDFVATFHLAVEPAADAIYFVSERLETASIWTMDTDGSNERLLLARAGLNVISVEVSPAGDRLAFGVADAEYTVPSRQLWLADLDGTNLWQLPVATRSPEGGVAWTPDGQTLVYDTWESGIYAINADGTNERQVSGHSWDNRPDVRADGRIVYVNNWYDEIHTVDLNGQNNVMLLAGGGLFHPHWSPDGGTILFGKSDGIWLMDADGGNPRRILALGTGEELWALSWTPDGSRILFSRAVGGNGDIWIMDRDAANVQRLTEDSAPDYWPCWGKAEMRAGEIRGAKWNDQDGNGVWDVGEAGLPGWTVFLDADGDSVLDTGEAWTTTALDGSYRFGNLAAGTYVVAEVPQANWAQTFPGGSGRHVVAIAEQGLADHVDFGSRQGEPTDLVNFVVPRDGTLYVRGLGGLAGWRSEFGFGTSAADYNAVLTNLPRYTDEVAVGPVSAGELLRFIFKTGATYAFSTGSTFTDREAFTDRNNSLGWGGTIVQATAPYTWVLHLDDPYGDDDDNDSWIQLRIDTGVAGSGEIHGRVWNDRDGDGARDGDEPALDGWTVFLDYNANGRLDPGEDSVQTGTNGDYAFVELHPRTYSLVQVGQNGWTQTYPAGNRGHVVTVAAGQVVTGQDFGNQGDEVPPRITAMLPDPATPATQGVRQIRLTFSEPMERVTMWAPSFALLGSGGDGRFTDGNETIIEIADVVWNGQNLSATLVLDGWLPRDTYRLTALDDLIDLSGNRLDGDGDGVAGGNWQQDFQVANTPPIANNGQAATVEDTPVPVLLAATDPDGDALTFVPSDPPHGTLTDLGDADSATWLYTPDAGFHGRDSFSFTASDGTATSQSATFGITVAPAPCDLEPTALHVTSPAHFSMGDTITVRWTGVNRGPGETLDGWWGDWQDRLYLSADGRLDGSDLVLGNWSSNASPVAVNGTYAASLDVTLPEREWSGQYYLILAVNADQGQVETNVANNLRVLPIQLDPFVRLVLPSVGRYADNETPVGFRWVDADQFHSAAIAIALDSDNDPGNGNETWLASGISEDADGQGDQAQLYLPDVASGEYFVRARLSNADGDYYSADTPIRVFERAFYSEEAMNDATGGSGYEVGGVEAGILGDRVYYRVLSNFPPIPNGGDIYINVGGRWQDHDPTDIVHGIAVNATTGYRGPLIPGDLYTNATFRTGIYHPERPTFISGYQGHSSGHSAAEVTSPPGIKTTYQIEGWFDLSALSGYIGQFIQIAWAMYCGNDIDDVILPGLPFPDLRGNGFAVTAPPSGWGSAFTLAWTEQNAGQAAAEASVAALYLSADSTIDTGDVPLGSLNIQALAAGQSQHGTIPLILPSAPPSGFAAGGAFYVGMISDSGGAVVEGDENNNANRGEGLDKVVFRVGEPDSEGPWIVQHTPNLPVSQLTGVEVTFNEVIDGASFGTGDVSLAGPGGSVPISRVTLVSGATYRIDFPAQAAAGIYSLRVGPQIQDLAGNLMNQNRRPPNGEVLQDVYTADIVVVTVPGACFSLTPWQLQDGEMLPVVFACKDAAGTALSYARVEIGGEVVPLSKATGQDEPADLTQGHSLDFGVLGLGAFVVPTDWWYTVRYVAPKDYRPHLPPAGSAAPHEFPVTVSYHGLFGLPVPAVTTNMTRVVSEFPEWKGPGWGWYAGDTHFHSSLTDNPKEFGTPLAIASLLGEQVGLDWFTFTDHSGDLFPSNLTPLGFGGQDAWMDPEKYWELPQLAYWWDSPQFQAAADAAQPLRGEEVNVGTPLLTEQHLLIYGFGDALLDQIPVAGGKLSENLLAVMLELQLRSGARSQAVFGYVAHPADDWSNDKKGFSKWTVGQVTTALQVRDAADRRVLRGFEFWNGDPDANRDAALAQWEKVLASNPDNHEWFLAGGSDEHLWDRFEIATNGGYLPRSMGRVRTVVVAPSNDPAVILEALRTGRSIVTNGPLFSMNVDMNGSLTEDPDSLWDFAADGTPIDGLPGSEITVTEPAQGILHFRWPDQSATPWGEPSKDDITLYHYYFKDGTLHREEVARNLLLDEGGYAGFDARGEWSSKQDTYGADWQIYRAELQRGDYHAYSNPIWINFGSIGGTISFRDRAGKLLSDKAVIPSQVKVSLWADNSPGHDWPATFVGEYSFGNPLRHSEMAYAISTRGLADATYDVVASVSGADRKIGRVTVQDGHVIDTQDLPAKTDLTLTYEDVELAPLVLWKSCIKRGANITYRFGEWQAAPGMEAEEKAAVTRALLTWADSNYVTFQATTDAKPDIWFTKSRTAAAMGRNAQAVPPLACLPLLREPWTVEFATDADMFNTDEELEFVPGAVPGISAANWRTVAPQINLEAAALHEIGHVLGLRYPTMPPIPYLVGDEDTYPDSLNQQWSIMTYLSSRDGTAPWLGWSDVEALKRINQSSLVFTSRGAVDLVLTDAAGHLLSKTQSAFPGAVYLETDLDGDGNLDDQIVIPNPVTQVYFLTVQPEAGADPESTVTLIAEDHGEGTLLLDDVAIGDLSGTPLAWNEDRTPPVVTIDPLAIHDPSPALQGTVDEPQAAVWVIVAGCPYSAVNNGDGTWTLAAGLIAPPLAPGVYDIQVATADALGNLGTDATTNELRIVNSPPLLDSSGTMTLTSINVNEVDNPGTSVAEIVASAGGDRITDPDDGDAEGIAIVAAEPNHGSWEYSTDNGAAWLDVGSPSDTAALLLASDAGTRLRFVPEPDFVGTLVRGITFRAWDQTVGGNGQTADIWNSGDGTSFSTLVATASITVLAANHPPADIVLDNTQVKENRPGDVIGNLTVVDEDAADTHTFFVADSRFEVVDGTLKLKVGVSLDEVLDAGLGVEVTVTDDGGLSLTRTLTLTVLKNDFPWSPVLPRDVDGNGMVQAVDVLIVINEINARGIRPLPVPPPAIPAFCFDAAPNNVLEAADVLAVINHINSHPAAGGEAESAADAWLAATAAETCRWAPRPMEVVADRAWGSQPSLRPLPSQRRRDPPLPLRFSDRPQRCPGPGSTAKAEPASEDFTLRLLALDDVLADIAEDVSAATPLPQSSPPVGGRGPTA